MPVAGIRVVDLTRMLPGPYCTMMLADMGAEVIKVDEVDPRFSIKDMYVEPDEPDEKGNVEEIIYAYRFVDRSKKRICIDLKKDVGKDVFFSLVRNADVLVEEFRPGVTKRLGIDYETVRETNPGIIYCSISSYGQNGPYRDLVGHNTNFLGMTGALAIKDAQHDAMVMPDVAAGDLGAGLHGVIAILGGLLARQKIGKGQFIDISIADCLFSWVMVQRAVPFFLRGYQPNRGDAGVAIHRTKDDKYICIVPVERWVWENTCSALGLEELVPLHLEVLEAVLPAGRKVSKEKTQEIKAKLSAVFRTKTRDEWFQILGKVNSSAAPVYTLQEALSDPQLRHHGMIHEFEHPHLGKILQIGSPINLSETAVGYRSLPSFPGQHTQEILTELGYSQDEIRRLDQNGAIKCRR